MLNREIPAALLLVSGAAQLYFVHTTISLLSGSVAILGGALLLRRR